MKKIFKYTFAFILGLSLCSCDALFDSVEGDLSKMSEEDMTASQAGMERLLSDVYNTIPMDAFNKKERNTTLASNSRNANYNVDVTGFWNYTKMRSINLFINGTIPPLFPQKYSTPDTPPQPSLSTRNQTARAGSCCRCRFPYRR